MEQLIKKQQELTFEEDTELGCNVRKMTQLGQAHGFCNLRVFRNADGSWDWWVEKDRIRGLSRKYTSPDEALRAALEEEKADV